MLITCTHRQSKPKLQKFKELLDSKLHALQDKQMKTREIEEACEEVCNELNDSILLLESQLNKAEHTYKMEKEEATNAIRQRGRVLFANAVGLRLTLFPSYVAFEIETVQQDIEKLKLETNNMLGQTQKNSEKSKQDLEDLERNCKKERDAVAQCLFETLDVLVEHRLSIEQALDGLQRDLKEQLNHAKGRN